jgi:antitoxin MazE
MVVQFARWGNSLAIRIPAGIAKEIGATEGQAADISVSNGRLILAPARQHKVYKLDDLLAGITPENLHSETDTGSDLGAEIVE